ncbi:heme-degrading domain-containing protein [Spirosoma sp. KCTC 42546]|uniref:heme-degrading domain-containing protein n=1 Tax=Spirosoma sp. KCTC 42546 TaxID=2520506 RepID=UPI001159CC88|nr:heme-degrading domain-containing protein [Spirosoma sp. KCTC 42546]QDK79322.1 heme-degrading domain-containing protein [Spirosoma sp. KCTC 42546]
MDASIDQDLARIALQEQQLQFDAFTHDTAWQLGTRLKESVEARGKAVAIDIQFMGQPLFFFAMPGTTPDNVDWIRRKRNVVLRYHRSSYAVGLELKKNQTTLMDKAGLPDRDYAPHGGCFPLWIRGTGCMGTLTISGLPQREDHNVLVDVLATWLNHPIRELALDTPS